MRSALLVTGLLAACDLAQQPTEPTAPDTSCEVISNLRDSMPSRALDLVFVVSDAPSMLPYRERLREHLPWFAYALEVLDGGLPSVQVAFVDGAGGFSTERLAACGIDGAFVENVQAPWFLCDEDDTSCRDANHPGTLAEAFACAGLQPADGVPGSPLLARALGALGPDNPDAAGFVRPDAFLAVVFITAEDDASPDSVDDYAEALRALKPDDSLVVIGVIAPYEAPRLIELGNAFPNRSARTAIVLDSWTDALVLWTGWGDNIPNPCVDAPVVDVDPDAPGMQANCRASDELYGPELPRCVMATPERPAPDTPLPCYWFQTGVADRYGCDTIAIVERAEHHYGQPATLRCECDAAD